jgi:hypothetical protein
MAEAATTTVASTAPAPKRALRALTDGKRFEAYAEQQTAEMRTCGLCQKVVYRRKPMKLIGSRWMCIDCLRQLKEALDSLERWEEMAALNAQIERNVEDGLKR